ncbi:MAG: hypothetical protein ABSB76_10435 [Streptosporangiaceae bacterium]
MTEKTDRSVCGNERVFDFAALASAQPGGEYQSIAIAGVSDIDIALFRQGITEAHNRMICMRPSAQRT